ncbi:single-stranded DNA-binding protein, partial [Klebsiella pneumoniae]|uniref:single-stranded DNA-binding protein n=1 Tax=Klebsiella pneumoniae TaxID=573 RepID=UPI003EE0FD0C
VAVDGRLDQRRYTDSQGQQREVIEVVADNVNALDRPREDGGGGGGMAPSGGGGGRASTAPSEAEYDPFADE